MSRYSTCVYYLLLSSCTVHLAQFHAQAKGLRTCETTSTVYARPSFKQSLNLPLPIPQPLLPLHNAHRQALPDPKQHKRRPLPPERIHQHHKHEPVHQLRVREEIKRRRRRQRLHRTRHVDPLLHPVSPRRRQRVDQEHQQQARVDPDVQVADGADGVDVRAVDRADARVLRWEALDVPARRAVGRGEDFVGEEGEGGLLVAGCHDDGVAGDEFLVAGAAFGDAGLAVVEGDAGGGDVLDVATEPGGAAGADLVEDLGVDHGRFGEEALGCRGEVFEVPVEEEAQEGFGDPGEDCFLAEDVKG